MPLVKTTEMLRHAQTNRYAVGAFNVENMEMIQAVIMAAEELRAPVIIQTTPGTVAYGSLELYAACTAVLGEKSSVPVAIHMDHGDSFELAEKAIRAGYTSVMIDGSHLSFEDNIELTKRAVNMAGSIPVEAELGKVGGKEDGLEAEGAYTDPEKAREFVRRTGAGSLAVAIGTAHGVYTAVPKLDIVRLREIRKVVDVPLVLHGASGLSDEDVQACVKEGICKVNFATELRIAYTNGVREILSADPNVYDPKKYSAKGRENVKKAVSDRINILTLNKPQ